MGIGNITRAAKHLMQQARYTLGHPSGLLQAYEVVEGNVLLILPFTFDFESNRELKYQRPWIMQSIGQSQALRTKTNF